MAGQDILSFPTCPSNGTSGAVELVVTRRASIRSQPIRSMMDVRHAATHLISEENEDPFFTTPSSSPPLVSVSFASVAFNYSQVGRFDVTR